jgi:hypothetical protein
VLVNLAMTPLVDLRTVIVTAPAAMAAHPTRTAVTVVGTDPIVSLITGSDTGAENVGGKKEASQSKMLTQMKVMIGLPLAGMTVPASALVVVVETVMAAVETSTAVVVVLVPGLHVVMVIAIVVAEIITVIALETAALVSKMTAEVVVPVGTLLHQRSPPRTIVTSALSSCSKSQLVLRRATCVNSSSLIVVQ